MAIISKALILGLILIFCLRPAWAEDVLMTPESFVAKAFSDTPPKPQSLWLTGELGDTASEILDRKAPPRTRYWKQGNKTAWVLEQIGKYKPITTGIIIGDDKIQTIQVLIYRESHGWEIKYPFFTDQFVGVSLTDMESHTLNKDIDGISGATLSVRAVIRLARLALRLHHEVTHAS